MKRYFYKDGFVRAFNDNYISPEQLKSDERKHGELILLIDGHKKISPIPINERVEVFNG